MAETLRLTLDPSALVGPGIEQAGATVRRVVQRVSEIWRTGGTVAFPTETVYGLGANALDAVAVAKIFAAKQRPGWDPLIVHVTDEAMLHRVAEQISPAARMLMEAFWPGPLTLLLSRSERVPLPVTAGRPLVGVRMPAHPVARALISAALLPIAAPSANSFGRTSPTTAAHVLEDLDGCIDAIVDGGSTALGLESTVVDANSTPAIVYRPGAISIEQLRTVIGEVVMYRRNGESSAEQPESLPSPGVDLRHYAPRAQLVLVELEEALSAQNAEFWFAVRRLGLIPTGARLGLMLPEEFVPIEMSNLSLSCELRAFKWGQWSDPDGLARRLFLGLRELDAHGVTHIVCPMPQEQGIGAAIRDRLRKAAKPR